MSREFTDEEVAAIDLVAELVDQQLMPKLREERASTWRGFIPWRSAEVRELSAAQSVLFRMWSRAHARELAKSHARAQRRRAEHAARWSS